MRWLLVVSGLLTTVAARADDGSYEASIDGALEFAECAGLCYASAELGPEFGHSPDDVDLALGLGNGAALAGQYLLAHVRVLSNRVHSRSRLRGWGNPAVAQQVEVCRRLNPLQVEAI